MRVLVTGAAGFVGSQVARALAVRGADVVAVDRARNGWGRLAGADAVRREAVDLADPSAIRALMRRSSADVLVHLAWYTRPEDYLASRENLASLAATTRLAAEALDAGCKRLVGVGTCLEYGPSTVPHREDDPAAPDTLYGACKHAARLVCERLAVGQASFAWARLFHLHGPSEDDRRLVPMVAGRLRRGEVVDLSPGEQTRDYLRVEDAADALVTVVLSELTGSVNVCSGRAVTLRQALTAVGEALGRGQLLRFGGTAYRPGERMRIEGDPASLRRLGWRPTWDVVPPSFAYLRGEQT